MIAGYLQNAPVFGEKDKNLDADDEMLAGVKAGHGHSLHREPGFCCHCQPGRHREAG